MKTTWRAVGGRGTNIKEGRDWMLALFGRDWGGRTAGYLLLGDWDAEGVQSRRAAILYYLGSPMPFTNLGGHSQLVDCAGASRRR